MKLQSTLDTKTNVVVAGLYMAFELADSCWKVAFSSGVGQEIVVRQVPARDIARLCQAMLEIRQQLGLESPVRIYSCYEAGFDSFWLHNRLSELGVDNVVIDAASLEINRRGRRSKTDRLDACQMVRKLIQFHLGDTQVFSVCRPPSRQDEDDRRIERERRQLCKEATIHRNRIQGVLKTHGLKRKADAKLIAQLDELECADGSPLGFQEKQEIRREYERLSLVDKQLDALEKELEQRLDRGDAKAQMVLKLARLKGVGARLAYGLVAEMFGWRKFEHRDQVGSYAGFDSAPYDTGQSTGRSQGISKAGNRWVRAIMHSVALNWLRWQPESHLSQWYRTKYANASRVERKKGRVALARKLLVRLWKWLEADELPWGAQVDVLTQNP